VSGLTRTSYHWRTRTVDSAGAASPWRSYGGNAETATDFTVLNSTPAAPTALGQRQANGITPLDVGGWATSSTVVFRGTVSDPDPGQKVRLQVQRQQVGTTYSSNGYSCQSALVASGTATSCSVTNLWPGLSYRWQARTVDSAGIASPWVAYATNADDETDFRVNRIPAQPTARGQRQADGITPLGLGGTATSSAVVFRGTVSDQDPGQQVRLQVEVQPLGTGFTGAVHCQSPLGSSGTATSCTVTGLLAGTSYHWQVRAADNRGGVSAWASFATNADTAADFVVTANPAPMIPTALGQRSADGAYPLRLGGSTGTTAVFAGTVTSPDPSQTVRLQVEVKPVGMRFNGSVSCQSALVPRGTATGCTVEHLPPFTSYHWRARTVDSVGVPSVWASYGANAETEADFTAFAEGS
jgi:predicted phage tail protein